MKRTFELARYTVSSGVANLVLNFALVPFLAEVGSAIASLVCYTLYATSMYLGGRKYVAWPLPWRTALSLLVPAGLLVAIHSFIGVRFEPQSVGTAALLAVVYVLVYLVLAGGTLIAGRAFLCDQLEFVVTIFRLRSARG